MYEDSLKNQRQTGDQTLKLRLKNPLPLIVRMWEANKKITPDEVMPPFKAAVLNDPDYLEEVILYYVVNNLRNLNKPEPKKRTKYTLEHLDKLANRTLGELVASMILPTGKTLLQSTGEEVKTFSKWGRAIAAIVGDDNVVGEVLNYTEIGKICKGVK